MTQIKSRERVQDLAEVYTHEREVNEMLDLVSDMFPSENDPSNHDRRFLEPACGHGNFLEAILQRKLATVTTARYGGGERFEFRIARCLASIYGIDICAENVVESRERLRAAIENHVASATGRDVSVDLNSAIDAILDTNIICADTLADATTIQLVEYRPGLRCTFARRVSFLEEPEVQLDLFGAAYPTDNPELEPTHYSHLATGVKQ